MKKNNSALAMMAFSGALGGPFLGYDLAGITGSLIVAFVGGLISGINEYQKYSDKTQL